MLSGVAVNVRGWLFSVLGFPRIASCKISDPDPSHRRQAKADPGQIPGSWGYGFVPRQRPDSGASCW